MNTSELLEQLSEKPKSEIEFALIELMLKNKIDFLTINKSYITYLEIINDDRQNQLIEAETCLLNHLTPNKKDKSYIQRSLYFLNKSKRFNMETLNNKFKYNEEEGKKQSWYENNKENIIY